MPYFVSLVKIATIMFKAGIQNNHSMNVLFIIFVVLHGAWRRNSNAREGMEFFILFLQVILIEISLQSLSNFLRIDFIVRANISSANLSICFVAYLIAMWKLLFIIHVFDCRAQRTKVKPSNVFFNGGWAVLEKLDLMIDWLIH